MLICWKVSEETCIITKLIQEISQKTIKQVNVKLY